MRKYYSASKHTKPKQVSGVNIDLTQELNPFDLLQTIIDDGSEHLEEDLYKRITHICGQRDVQGYLKVSTELDLLITTYTKATPLIVIQLHRQIAAFLKKYPFTKKESGLDPLTVGTQKWESAERQCEQANDFLSNVKSNEIPVWINKARSLIANVLGELTSSRIMQILRVGGHGPGMSLESLDPYRTTAYYKYTTLPYQVTDQAKSYAYAMMSSVPRWVDFLESTGRRKELPPLSAPLYQKELMLFNDCVTSTNYERLSFVPKDAKTMRPIGIGSSLNMRMQLGVKVFMTERLKQIARVDLLDQSRNQEMARLGSLYCGNDLSDPLQFSTIDLASASDTISIGIVKMLLPADWYAFLDDLRFKGALVGDDCSPWTYSKFSAMGNGFTFPLESLIFWAIAKATALELGAHYRAHDLSVYGDDIICRYGLAPHLIKNLEWSGFTVNTEKSFIKGLFKESCGADYFNGTDVRPFYLKRRLVDARDIYFVANAISRRILTNSTRVRLSSLYHYLVDNLDKTRILYGPLSDTSDTNLIVPISFMNKLGLRPFLSQEEKDSLIRCNILSHTERSHNNLCYAYSEQIVPNRYRKINSSVQLAMCLEYKDHLQHTLSYHKIDSNLYMQHPSYHLKMNKKDLMILEATSTGKVTRRGKFTYKRTMNCVPNWDANYHPHRVLRHPINWMK